MTTELTPEEKRVKIAGACGWSAKEDEEGYWRAVMPDGVFEHSLWMSERNVWYSGIPDYFRDLNACHEMEKMLTEKRELQYLVNLMRAMNEPGTIGWRSERTYKATAAQRCEAFGRTLNLW